MTRSSNLAKRRYSIAPRTRKYIKRYEFLSFAKNLSNKYGKQLLDSATKSELNSLKSTSKKVVHKAAEATGEFIGNKISDRIVKSEGNSGNVEEIIIPSEKAEEILNKFRQEK